MKIETYREKYTTACSSSLAYRDFSATSLELAPHLLALWEAAARFSEAVYAARGASVNIEMATLRDALIALEEVQ